MNKQTKTQGNDVRPYRRYADKGFPLVRRQRIFLVSSCALDDDYFAAVFRETWKRIPRKVRARISLAAKKDSCGLEVRIFRHLRQDRDGEANGRALRVSFSARLVDLMPTSFLRRTIAHELAHVFDDLGRDAPTVELEADEAELERRIEAITDSWGFPRKPETKDKADNERIARNARRYLGAATGEPKSG